jgi:sporulation protein YlmC with PRC-barrel domain
MRWQHSLAALAGTAVVASGVCAAEPQLTPGRTNDARSTALEDQDGKILAARTFRTSKLSGLNVRNMKGEELGEVKDFVIDLKTGKVQYAAMSVGGLLGIGDKLFAVPFSKLRFDHGQDEMFFVLDMPKEKIAAAPGFDQNDWPDFADPNWTDRIEKHYRQTEVRTGENAEQPAAEHPRQQKKLD